MFWLVCRSKSLLRFFWANVWRSRWKRVNLRSKYNDIWEQFKITYPWLERMVPRLQVSLESRLCAYLVLCQEMSKRRRVIWMFVWKRKPPNPFLLADFKEYLQNLFKCSVDVVRFHKNMNPFFKSRIERDGIYAI